MNGEKMKIKSISKIVIILIMGIILSNFAFASDYNGAYLIKGTLDANAIQTINANCGVTPCELTVNPYDPNRSGTVPEIMLLSAPRSLIAEQLISYITEGFYVYLNEHPDNQYTQETIEVSIKNNSGNEIFSNPISINFPNPRYSNNVLIADGVEPRSILSDMIAVKNISEEHILDGAITLNLLSPEVLDLIFGQTIDFGTPLAQIPNKYKVSQSQDGNIYYLALYTAEKPSLAAYHYRFNYYAQSNTAYFDLNYENCLTNSAVGISCNATLRNNFTDFNNGPANQKFSDYYPANHNTQISKVISDSSFAKIKSVDRYEQILIRSYMIAKNTNYYYKVFQCGDANNIATCDELTDMRKGSGYFMPPATVPYINSSNDISNTENSGYGYKFVVPNTVATAGFYDHRIYVKFNNDPTKRQLRIELRKDGGLNQPEYVLKQTNIINSFHDKAISGVEFNIDTTTGGGCVDYVDSTNPGYSTIWTVDYNISGFYSDLDFNSENNFTKYLQICTREYPNILGGGGIICTPHRLGLDNTYTTCPPEEYPTVRAECIINRTTPMKMVFAPMFPGDSSIRSFATVVYDSRTGQRFVQYRRIDFSNCQLQ